MKRIYRYCLALAAVATLLGGAAATPASAQEAPAPAEERAPAEDSWYRSPTPRAEQLTIARQKAMQRGQERMARLQALKWYGYSNSRPTAATLPFTTMYSPAWQQPGGRPFAWYTSSRPVVIYANGPVYR
jgi:hypothetical protein